MARALAAIRPYGLAILFAACSTKSARDEAPRSTTPSPVAGATPVTPESPPPVQPSGSANAKEAARSSGHLGPTTNQAAFDELDGNTEGGKPKRGVDAPGGGGRPSNDAKVGGSSTQGQAEAYVVTLSIPTIKGLIEGGADANSARTALASRSKEIQACYDQARTSKPELVGALRLDFTIEADGKLAKVSVATSTLKDPALEACVIGVVKTTKLAKPLAGGAVKGALSIAFTKRAP